MPGIVARRRVLHRLVDRQHILEGPALDPARGPAREIGRPGAHRDRRVHARTAAKHLAADRVHVMAEPKVILACDNPSRAPASPPTRFAFAITSG